MGLLDSLSPKATKWAVGLCILVPGDQAWILISTAIVLLMTPGLAFFYGGMIQHKNFVSTIMQVCIALAVIPIVWSLIGFALAFGPSISEKAGLFGNPATFGLLHNVGAAPLEALAPTIPCSLFFLFQMVFATITPALIIGSIADRANVSALCIFCVFWHIIVYCPLAHMVWYPTGLIRTFGVPDFAGGTVVHMSSGYAALAAAKYVGHGHRPASGFHILEPANVPFVVLGTALLWFGWFGFNGGSALAASPLASFVFLNTNAAAAAAMLTWMLMDILRGKKMRATGACIGAVIGLIAITPAAGFVNTGAAFLIGLLASVVCSGVQELMERYGKRYVDDTLDVFACHGVGGTVGMILTALFTTTSVNEFGFDGAFYGNPVILGKCLLVLVVLVPWLLLATWGCLWVTDLLISVRVSDEEMLAGLDVSKHGERAYSGTAGNDLEVAIADPATASKKAAATLTAPVV
ncbi:MAG: ammonium transporter [Monoraphidium minutum]|nr:MAG: ammonium transporter [Monoraphidium minutum]